MRLHALPAVGDRRVSGRQVDIVRRGRPQHVQQLVVQAQRLLGDARVNGRLHRGLRTDVTVEGHVGRVHRVGRRLHERHIAEGVAAVIGHRLDEAREGLRRGARVRVVHGPALSRVRQQREGLERGPRHRDVLRHSILLALLVIGSAVLGEDLARVRVDRRQGDVLVGRVPPVHRVHRLCSGHRLVLALLHDRRRDAQAALGDLVLEECARIHQLLLDVRDQVAVRPLHGLAVEGVGVDGLGEDRCVRVGLRHPSVLHHQAQDPFPTLFRLVGADSGIPCRRRGDDARDHRGFRQGHVLRRMPEVGLRGRLDAVGAAPEVDGVEVVPYHFVLGLRAVDLDGQHRFLEFADVGGGLPHEIALHVLLGEGGPALAGPAAQVVPQGAQDALEVHARVRVESPVLRGHDGLRHVVGQGGGVDDLAVHIPQRPHLRGAVGVVHRCLLRQRQVVRLGDGDRRVQVEERGHAQDDDSEQGEDDAEADLAAEAALLLAALLALAVLAPGVGVPLGVAPGSRALAVPAPPGLRPSAATGLRGRPRGRVAGRGSRTHDVVPVHCSVVICHEFSLSADLDSSSLTGGAGSSQMNGASHPAADGPPPSPADRRERPGRSGGAPLSPTAPRGGPARPTACGRSPRGPPCGRCGSRRSRAAPG